MSRRFGSWRLALGVSVIVAGASPAFAGGSHIAVERPDAIGATVPEGTIAVARMVNCHGDVAKMPLTGAATAVVDGERRSVPLVVTPVGDGWFAVPTPFPKAPFVLALTGRQGDVVIHTLVPVTSAGMDTANIQWGSGPFRPEAVDRAAVELARAGS